MGTSILEAVGQKQGDNLNLCLASEVAEGVGGTCSFLGLNP